MRFDNIESADDFKYDNNLFHNNWLKLPKQHSFGLKLKVF